MSINSNANAFTGYCQVNTLRDIVCRRTESCELPDSVDDIKDDSSADNIYGFNNITRYYRINKYQISADRLIKNEDTVNNSIATTATL